MRKRGIKLIVGIVRTAKLKIECVSAKIYINATTPSRRKSWILNGLIDPIIIQHNNNKCLKKIMWGRSISR